MSHTVTIDLKLTDKIALEKAIKALNLKAEQGTFQLYSTKEEGLGVYLPGWRYPAVIKEDGTVAYDNFNGIWGKQEELNKLKARYGVEKAKIEARKKGYKVLEKRKGNEIVLELYK